MKKHGLASTTLRALSALCQFFDYAQNLKFQVTEGIREPMIDKRTAYEESMRVPLVMWGGTMTRTPLTRTAGL